MRTRLAATWACRIAILLIGFTAIVGFTAIQGADSNVRRPSPPSARLASKQLRIQVLLDRARFSPGEIDGLAGRVSRIALQDFQKSHRRLDDDPSVPTLIEYTITEDDVRGPFVKIPSDLEDQADLPALGFESPIEAIGEKFHSSPKLLKRLNPRKDFSKSGEVIRVPDVRPEDSHPGKAASVVVSKSRLTVQALDENGKILATTPRRSAASTIPCRSARGRSRGSIGIRCFITIRIYSRMRPAQIRKPPYSRVQIIPSAWCGSDLLRNTMGFTALPNRP